MSLVNERVDRDERLENGKRIFTDTIAMKCIAYRQGGALLRSVHEWAQGDATWPHVIEQAPMLVYLRNGMARVCPTREPLRYLEFGLPYLKVGGVWTQVNLGAPTRTGNKVSWSTAQADVWCQFGGHKLDIGKARSKGGWRPPNNQIAYPVGVNGLTRSGLTFLQDGVPVMSLQAPTVADADNPMDVRPVQTQLVQVSGQWYAVMTLDTTGWTNWELDPTLTLQPNAADGVDAFITKEAVTTNYGTHTDTGIGDGNWGAGGGGTEYRELIKFDLSTIAATATITSAVLSLYIYADYANNASVQACYRQKRAWVEAETTWNIYSTGNNWQTAGGFGANDCEQADIGSRNFTAAETLNEFKDWSLTAAKVQEWTAGSFTNNGLMMKSTTPNRDMYAGRSSDHGTAAQRPQLVIAYTLPGGGARRMFIPDLGHIQMRGA